MNISSSLLSVTKWNFVLLFLVVFTIFVVGVFPMSWHYSMYGFFYTLIYIVSILALKMRHRKLFLVSIFMIVIQWSGEFFDMDRISLFTDILIFTFFGFIATRLIMQVATAEKVGRQVILESINGYLLMGLVFSIIVAMVTKFDPGAINFPETIFKAEDNSVHFSDCLYYTFVSITTMGYGDFVPTEAYTKSLATLIGVSGQLYVAIIIALLVGKFSSQK